MNVNRRNAMISMGRVLMLGSTLTASGLIAACSKKRPLEMMSDEERRDEEAKNFADVARKRDEELRKQKQAGGSEGGGEGGHSH